MSTGLNKTIKIGFLSDQTSGWMGGVNYYKNLFIAISKVGDPKLIPYILPFNDEKIQFLYNYAKKIKMKKRFFYYVKKFFSLFRKKKFNKQKYLKPSIKFDIVSHMQIPVKEAFIAWIPDFQHLHLPEMFSNEELEYRTNNFHQLAQKSKAVILSSNDALEDFKKFAPKYAHKGKVLHFVAIPDENIYQKTDEIKEEIIEKYKLPPKYFYVPNQFWVHKNHKIVFEAISILKQQDFDINVVFTGSTSDYRHANYFNDLMNFAKARRIENNIKILGLVDLVEVYYLMRNCISIVNPSLFEGWSSTVEEAKSLGKNIILSNLKVHKEQNPPEGIYFNPHNPNELAEILKEKWLNGSSNPDYELERQAKEQLEDRIIEFGTTYQKIILEALIINR